MQSTDVLIVGAGPTGLVLGLWLTRLGVRVRIVDKNPRPGTTSRAIAVQARTLELYRALGLARPILEEGLPFDGLNLWAHGAREGRMELGSIGEGRSPFPFVMSYPQDAHERLLLGRLMAFGVRVEREVELLEFEDTPDGIQVRLQKKHGERETATCHFLAGCDGASSTVRERLNIGFHGGTYQHRFYVADVRASGPQMNGELHLALEDEDFLALFPLDRHGHARLIGTVKDDTARTYADVDQRVIDGLGLHVDQVSWFSTYRVHHRVADAFRSGRVFLLGDAAHVHSPVGGQGMNTGIGDAVNLAWKLAATVHGRIGPSVLDTYEEERRPFAQKLVHTTDRAFDFVTANGTLASRIRLDLAPRILTRLFQSPRFRRLAFDTVSQTKIDYRHCHFNDGRSGKVRGGDRLPWVQLADGRDNFEALASMGWQVHVYGTESSSLRAVCRGRRVALNAFPWGPHAEQAGLRRDAGYLVRPDGYVGLAFSSHDNPDVVARYMEERGIRAPLRRIERPAADKNAPLVV